MHKYMTIVMDIRHKISSGEYTQGEKLLPGRINRRAAYYITQSGGRTF